MNWEEKWLCPFVTDDELQAKFNGRNIVIRDWSEEEDQD